MAMVTIIGSNATAPTVEGPASCYLVPTDTGFIMVDAGPGSLVCYLQAGYTLQQLRAIVITHFHADHSLDLMALAYRWTFPELLPKIPLFVPTSATPTVERFDAVFSIPTLANMASPICESFAVTEMPMDGTTEFEIDGCTLTTFTARHAVPSASLRIRTSEGSIAFSSDTGDCAGLRAAVEGVDVFVCESTYLTGHEEEMAAHGHLTPALAAEIITSGIDPVVLERGDVEAFPHLVLTHFTYPSEWEEGLALAKEAYAGRVSIAKPGLAF